nr:MAG TPA: hypothetical protein [Bacteriophage sp.]
MCYYCIVGNWLIHTATCFLVIFLNSFHFYKAVK